MKREILYSYLDKLSISTGDLAVFYSFDHGSGDVVFNDVYSIEDHFYSGGYLRADRRPGLSVGLSENPTSNVISGSGIFSYGDMVRIGDTVDFNEWTAFLNYKALNYCGAAQNEATVLLTSSLDENVNSGFVFGINQANRPFFEYDDGISKKSYILNQELGPQNILSLSKIGNSVQFTYHDYPNQDNISKSFTVSGFNNNNQWYIGGMYGLNTLYTGLSGYFDDFLLFGKSLPLSTRNSLVDAFFVSGILPASTVLTTGYTNSILDVILNPTGFLRTGVIGSSPDSSILIPQLDGSDISLTRMVDITGIITGETIEYVTGEAIPILVSTPVPEQALFDYDYMIQFTKPIFVYKNHPIISSDTIESYNYNKIIKTNNVKPTYNPTLKTFDMPSFYTGGNLNVYSNGILDVSGVGYAIRYDQTNRKLYNPTWSGFADNTVVDIIEGNQAYYAFTGGSGTLVLSNSNYNNKDLYLNGQKLVSGFNYTVAANAYSLYNIQDFATGLIHFAPRRTDISSIVTGNVSFNLQNVINDQIWLNGQRLARNVDYFNTSSCSLRQANDLTGFSSLIYDNSLQFFDL